METGRYVTLKVLVDALDHGICTVAMLGQLYECE
jgi:hypothetical protein